MSVEKGRSTAGSSRSKAAARKAGIKLTPPGLEILCEIAGRLVRPDAETVFRAVHARMATVSLDTVHRTFRTRNDLGAYSHAAVAHASMSIGNSIITRVATRAESSGTSNVPG